MDALFFNACACVLRFRRSRWLEVVFFYIYDMAGERIWKEEWHRTLGSNIRSCINCVEWLICRCRKKSVLKLNFILFMIFLKLTLYGRFHNIRSQIPVWPMTRSCYIKDLLLSQQNLNSHRKAGNSRNPPKHLFYVFSKFNALRWALKITLSLSLFCVILKELNLVNHKFDFIKILISWLCSFLRNA